MLKVPNSLNLYIKHIVSNRLSQSIEHSLRRLNRYNTYIFFTFKKNYTFIWVIRWHIAHSSYIRVVSSSLLYNGSTFIWSFHKWLVFTWGSLSYIYIYSVTFSLKYLLSRQNIKVFFCFDIYHMSFPFFHFIYSLINQTTLKEPQNGIIFYGQIWSQNKFK